MDNFSIWAGIDVPFGDTGYSIHQPSLREIATLGEEPFFQALNMLLINKKTFKTAEELSTQELFLLIYDIIDKDSGDLCEKVMDFLLLLFPIFDTGTLYNYNIILAKDLEDLSQGFLVISDDNFLELQEKLRMIFFLQDEDSANDYNPANEQARIIAEKLKRGREIADAQRGESEENKDFLIRYCSILSIGLQMDISLILNYTYLQFKDLLTRFHLNVNFDIGIKFRAAGATVELEEWEKKIN